MGDLLNETYVYPSTAKWAKDLNVANPSKSGNTKESDTNYLESLRIDQKQRLKSKMNKLSALNSRSNLLITSLMTGSIFSLYFGSKYSGMIRNHRFKVGAVLSVMGAISLGAQYFK